MIQDQLNRAGITAGRKHIGTLWKSVKYERVYLHAYDTVTEARRSIMQYLDWYNKSRPHSRLGKRTPDEVYNMMLPTVDAVA